MNIKHNKIEMILASSLLFMVLAFGYKGMSQSKLSSSQEELATAKEEIMNIIALQELWGDKKISKKVKTIERLLPQNKVAFFTLKGKRLKASFKEMQIGELNRLSNKIVGMAVEIVKFDLSKEAKGYRLELVCKW